MSTSFKAVKFETKDEIDSVECGHTLSAARLKSGEGYIWGTGLPSKNMNIYLLHTTYTATTNDNINQMFP